MVVDIPLSNLNEIGDDPTDNQIKALLQEPDADFTSPDDPNVFFKRSSSNLLVRHNGDGNTITEAVYHLVCVIAGSGILQLPYTLNQSGWIGILLICFSAWANVYCGRLLIKCLYAPGERLRGGFPEVGQLAFGHHGRMAVIILTNCMLVGVPIVYLILSGMNLNFLFPVLSVKAWILMCGGLVLVPLLLYRSLKEIAIISAFGVFASIAVIVTVVLYAVLDIPRNMDVVRHKIIEISRFPSALASVSFAYAGNFVYPEVEAAMSNPSDFPNVLTISMSLISTMYLLTAMCGYGAYGDKTQSPILGNLPSGLGTSFAVAVITAHVLLAMPILLTTFALDIERKVFGEIGSGKKIRLREVFIRALCVIVIVVLAMAVPFFSDFMSLLGALANTNLIFIFPIVFDFKIFGFKKRSRGDKLKGVAILAVGLFGGCVGGAQAIVALVNDFTRPGNATSTFRQH